jgi:hypothetical protein
MSTWWGRSPPLTRDSSPRRSAIRLVSSAGNIPTRPLTASSDPLSAPADGPILADTSTPTGDMVSYDSLIAFLSGIPIPNRTIATPAVTVNYLTRLPRKIRDQIHAYALPDEILVKDGKMDSTLSLLLVNHQSRAEYLEAIESLANEIHSKLEFDSITSLVSGLDSFPDLSLARFERLTIFTTGPYKGHSNQYTASSFHACNVCPTFQQNGDDCWFEIEYACRFCEANYEREL